MNSKVSSTSLYCENLIPSSRAAVYAAAAPLLFWCLFRCLDYASGDASVLEARLIDVLFADFSFVVSSTDGVAMPCYLLVYEYVRLRDKNLWARFSKQYFIVLNSTKSPVFPRCCLVVFFSI